MDHSDEAELSGILAEIERLGARPVAEIGVPMFLVPEDLSAPPAEEFAEADEPPSPLGAAFARAAGLLEHHRGELSARDVAALLEVLAERAFGSAAEEARA